MWLTLPSQPEGWARGICLQGLRWNLIVWARLTKCRWIWPLAVLARERWWEEKGAGERQGAILTFPDPTGSTMELHGNFKFELGLQFIVKYRFHSKKTGRVLFNSLLA